MSDPRISLRRTLQQLDTKDLQKRYAKHAGRLLSEVKISHPADRRLPQRSHADPAAHRRRPVTLVPPSTATALLRQAAPYISPDDRQRLLAIADRLVAECDRLVREAPIG